MSDQPAARVVRGADRFRTRTDWSDTRHSFSFGAHYDPTDVGHGRLLVNNHELVRSGHGFDDHPHADAEIVTWVLRGSLLHEDSAGHRGIVHRGLAQRMSAGRGIVHAERNDAYRIDPGSERTPVEYVQMWIRPDEPGVEPSYQQQPFDPDELDRGWLPIASGQHDAVITIGSAATLWATRVGPSDRRDVPGGDHVHVYVASGRCVLDGVGVLAAGDAVRLERSDGVTLRGPETGEPAELLCWQMDA